VLTLMLGACTSDGLGAEVLVEGAPALVPSTAESEPVSATTTGAAEAAPVLIGAGDIAAEASEAGATAAIIQEFPEATVFTTGDNAYTGGSSEEFLAYCDSTWGRFKDRTRPSIGNHDARSEGAGPYFDYFGTNAGTPGRAGIRMTWGIGTSSS